MKDKEMDKVERKVKKLTKDSEKLLRKAWRMYNIGREKK